MGVFRDCPFVCAFSMRNSNRPTPNITAILACGWVPPFMAARYNAEENRTKADAHDSSVYNNNEPRSFARFAQPSITHAYTHTRLMVSARDCHRRSTMAAQPVTYTLALTLEINGFIWVGPANEA